MMESHFENDVNSQVKTFVQIAGSVRQVVIPVYLASDGPDDAEDREGKRSEGDGSGDGGGHN